MTNKNDLFKHLFHEVGVENVCSVWLNEQAINQFNNQLITSSKSS